MDAKIAGALFGFAVGAAGYVIFKYWILPIRDYRRLKSVIEKDLEFYMDSIARQNWNSGEKKRLKGTKKAVSDLNDTYDFDLPVWYKIVLRRRGESPKEAEKHLMGLADTKDASHAEKRLEKAKAALSLHGPGKES